MAVAPQVSYPGVYIQEVPSGVRTITAVPTAITVFIGRSLRGPVNEPTLVTNLGQFDSLFGGLWEDSEMTYAVQDYYQNGGSQAIILRLFNAPPPGNLKKLQKDVDDAQKALDKAESDAEKNDADAKIAKDALDALLKAAAADTTIKEAQKAFDDAAKETPPDPASVKAAAAELEAAYDKFEGGTPKTTVAAARKKLADALGIVKEVNQASKVLAAAQKAVAFASSGVAQGEQLNLVAASSGSWGNKLEASVDRNGIDTELAKMFGVNTAKDLFNLTIRDTEPGGSVERISNVSILPNKGKRRLDRVLQQESLLVRVRENTNQDPDLPTAIPTANTPFAFAGGQDSNNLTVADYQGEADQQTGLFALNKADLFTLMCIPPDVRGGDTDPDVFKKAIAYCADRRAMLIIDAPAAWAKIKETAADKALNGFQTLAYAGEGPAARNSAIYFPRVIKGDPLRENQPDVFAPSGIIAGVMARTDATRGVWKAPAGLDATLGGIQGLQVNLNDGDNGRLNPVGINCLRNFRVGGNVVWGARTVRGADQLADDYKYIPVRRLVLMIEETLYRSTQWAVFEPNDEPLWAQLRLNVGAFMHDLFRQGAFQGQSPKDAYFVRCDSTTTTQSDINKGIVNIMVGFAPLKPAEFVVIYIQQIAGNIAT